MPPLEISDVDFLFCPPAGWNIAAAADDLLRFHQRNPRCIGFVFNDTIVHYQDEDTVSSILDRYWANRGG